MTESITVSGRDNLVAHIEGLQGALARRNATIEDLRERLRSAEAGEPNQAALEKAFRNGWEACAMRLERITREAALSLGEIRKNALDIYYEGEKK